MNVDAATIERMVREVLNQTQAAAPSRPLAALPKASAPTLISVPAVTPPGVPATRPQAAVEPALAASSRSIAIAERIVTEALLQQQASPGSTIVVSKRAIVTPAAADYLRNNRIKLERIDAGPTNTEKESAVWRILVSGMTEQTLRAVDVVCEQQRNTTRELSGTYRELALTAISYITRATVTGVICLTHKPDVVACLTNRNDRIRAGVVTDLADLSELVTHVSPNVVCMSPRGRTFMEVQNILTRIVTGPTPKQPADW